MEVVTYKKVLIKVETKTSLNHIILIIRVVAKITFNYIAKTVLVVINRLKVMILVTHKLYNFLKVNFLKN